MICDLLGFLDFAFFQAFGANVYLADVAVYYNADLLDIWKEFTFCPADDLASGPAFLFGKAFSDHSFARQRAFLANSAFFKHFGLSLNNNFQ